MSHHKSPHPSVYLAGSITGLSWNEATSWRQHVAAALAPNIRCFSPLRAKQYLARKRALKDSYLAHVMSLSRSINERDHHDCMTCDLIFVNLLGAKRISIGTVMEVAWGFAYRKLVVLALDRGGVHDHSMLRESSSFVVHDLPAAIEVTRAALLP